MDQHGFGWLNMADVEQIFNTSVATTTTQLIKLDLLTTTTTETTKFKRWAYTQLRRLRLLQCFNRYQNYRNIQIGQDFEFICLIKDVPSYVENLYWIIKKN